MTVVTPARASGSSMLQLENPKIPAGEFHHPERGRRLVDRDEGARIQRSEEEGLPALRPALHGGGVEVVAHADPPRFQT